MKYTANTPIKYGVDRFEIGDCVEMTEKEAKPFVEDGTLGVISSKSKKEIAEEEKAQVEAERRAALPQDQRDAEGAAEAVKKK